MALRSNTIQSRNTSKKSKGERLNWVLRKESKPIALKQYMSKTTEVVDVFKPVKLENHKESANFLIP